MKILFVDDNATNCLLYGRVAASIPSCEAECFTSAPEALKWCRKELPSMAVVDYRMPRVDGLTFIRKFRALPGGRDIPIVMLTSVGSPVLWQMALDAGADGYLMKPIEKNHFVSIVERLVKPVADAVR